MSSVCIQVINPNTSLAMTETIGAAARAVAAPGTEILAVCPTAGVPSIGETTLTKPCSCVTSIPSPPNSPRVCTCMSSKSSGGR